MIAGTFKARPGSLRAGRCDRDADRDAVLILVDTRDRVKTRSDRVESL